MSDDWPPSGDPQGLAAASRRVATDDECDRCGAVVDHGDFCEGCYRTVALRRAQR